jgi:hypothetical protein
MAVASKIVIALVAALMAPTGTSFAIDGKPVTPTLASDNRAGSRPQTSGSPARLGEHQSTFLRCEQGEALFCLTLGHQFRKGDGVAKDEARAAGHYERACNLGYGRGCVWFARAIGGTEKDRARAAAKKACQDLKEPSRLHCVWRPCARSKDCRLVL